MNDSPTSGEPIRDRQVTADWSHRNVTERSPEGFSLNNPRWRELRMDEAKTSSGKQLCGVAAILGASEQVAGRATLATTSLKPMPDNGPIRTANAIHADLSLTKRDRPIVTAAVREMSAKERGGRGDAALMNQTGGDPAGEQQGPDTTSAEGEHRNWYSLASDARRTEGMVHRDALDEAGEDPQAADDDEDGGA